MPILVILGRLLTTLLVVALQKMGPALLTSLGLSLVTNAAVQAVLIPSVMPYFQQLPDYILQTCGMMHVDSAFSIIASAIVVRRTMGSFKVSLTPRPGSPGYPQLPSP